MTGNPGTPADYQAALLASAPYGLAWPEDPSSVFGQICGAAGDGLARAAAVAWQIARYEVSPQDASILLPEWLDLTGVDPALPTVTQRVLALARINSLGGQSPGYFQGLAVALGYTNVTIEEFRPARYGPPGRAAKYGQPMCSEAWRFWWRVRLPETLVRTAQYGISRYGDPYASWGDLVLETEFRRLKPAHTNILFSYSGGS